MDISFAYTTPAVVAGEKTVTRREWKPTWARRWKVGNIYTAVDRQRRFGGKPIGAIRLTHPVSLESSERMPDSDFEAEGFAFLAEHTRVEEFGMTAEMSVNERVNAISRHFRLWQESGVKVYVVRFELIKLTPFGKTIQQQYVGNTEAKR